MEQVQIALSELYERICNLPYTSPLLFLILFFIASFFAFGILAGAFIYLYDFIVLLIRLIKNYREEKRVKKCIG